MARRIALLLRLDHRYERDVVLGASAWAAEQGWELLLPDYDGLPAEPAAMACDGFVVRVTGAAAHEPWSDARPAVNVSAQVLPGAEQVSNDPEATGRMAAQHLLSLGFRRLVWRSSDRMDELAPRGRGFAAAAREAGVPVEDCLWHDDPSTPWSVQAEIAQATSLLARCGPRVGIGAFSCEVARRTLAACARLRWRVPEDAALVACDHDEVVCSSASPELSAVDNGAERIGRTAMQRLAVRFAGGAPQPAVRLPPLRVLVRRSSDPSAVPDPLLAEALRWIRANAVRDCAIGDLALHLHCSRRLVEQRFRAVLGRSPGEEILRARLEAAKALLADTDLGLDAIAGRCGFARASRLVEAFSRLCGEPPGAWRKRHRPT